MGEITTNCRVDFQKVVREVVADIGYTAQSPALMPTLQPSSPTSTARAPTSHWAPTIRWAAGDQA